MFQKLINNLLISFMILIILGCNCIKPYTPPVFQGKEISSKNIFQIYPNMTKNEIIYILGFPDIVDIFNCNQFIYIHTYKKNILDKEFNELKLILTFDSKNKLINISGNYNPPINAPIF